MESKLFKLAEDLKKGLITEIEARVFLLDLLIIPVEELETCKLTIVHADYCIYQLRQDNDYLTEGSLFYCYQRAFEILQKYKSIKSNK